MNSRQEVIVSKHQCKQLERYNNQAQKDRYNVAMDASQVEIIFENGAWYRVQGKFKTHIGCCTFCGKPLK